MVDFDAITQGIAQETFTEAFRQFVGRSENKPFTYGQVHDATGITVKTLKSYAEGAACPCWYKLLKLFNLFGPEFVTKCLHPAGLGGVERISPDAMDENETLRLLVQEANEIVQRQADGVFCHRDRKEVADQLLKLSRSFEQTAKAWLEDGQ